MPANDVAPFKAACPLSGCSRLPAVEIILSTVADTGVCLLPNRIYERDTDALFLRLFRKHPNIARAFANLVTGKLSTGDVEVKGQVLHTGSTGSIDIVMRFKSGPLLLIENKIDAGYSTTRLGHGQPQRYKRTVETFRQLHTDAYSVLLAPNRYLASSRLAHVFDARITYESLRAHILDTKDRAILDAAILQAETPYEPEADVRNSTFFAAVRRLITDHFPDLVMNREPNAEGIRPGWSHTIYFDVPRTLRPHTGVARILGLPALECRCNFWIRPHLPPQ